MSVTNMHALYMRQYENAYGSKTPMGLTACAEYDKNTGARERLTGWGHVCKDRAARKVSRKARRESR